MNHTPVLPVLNDLDAIQAEFEAAHDDASMAEVMRKHADNMLSEICMYYTGRRPKRDLRGQRFGAWTVLSQWKVRGHITVWSCICDCGTRRWVPMSILTRGMSRSCGCQRGEKISAFFKRHGMTNSREYTTWCSIQGRCHNPRNQKYHAYGGRGIYVCERWRESFENFYADMGPRPSPWHSIDRIDNDGPYSPENCRWATIKEQSRNKRSTVYLELNGVRRPMVEWVELTGIPHRCIRSRLKMGWSIERALTEPVRKMTRE